jgi:sulfur relay (sulfurtransferase) DsrC/TusE family protein
MQIDNKATENSSQTSNEITDTKQHLITDEKFQLLRQCQQEIYIATEASPSIRKIINEVITEENLQKVKLKFIAVWKI